MPQQYLRRLTGRERTKTANHELARYLAFVAGATNAGGFLAVRQYTSHMSGITSSMADNLALGRPASGARVRAGCHCGIYVSGAVCTTLLVRWGRRHALHSEHALPVMARGSVTGRLRTDRKRVFVDHTTLGTVLLLCFTMGLQNAIVSKLSNAESSYDACDRHDHGHRHCAWTHAGLCWRATATQPMHSTGRSCCCSVRWLRLFFAGGVVGALGFKHVGFLFTLPLAFDPAGACSHARNRRSAAARD